MSLIFDHKAYGYSEQSRSILFDATDDDTVIHFALPLVALSDHLGETFTSDTAMWEAFHRARVDVETRAEAYWKSISEQHLRDGTAPPLGTPLVLISLDD